MDAAGGGRHRRLDSDSDSDVGGAPRLVMTTAKASDACPVPHRLIARSLAYTHLDDMSTLSSLDYVDVTDNSLTTLTGLASLPRLKTLIARGNLITSAAAAALSQTPSLRVLNLAENALADTDFLARAAFAPSLEALVINGNRVAVLDGVAALTGLETLVVSHNEVEDLSVVRFLPRLKKLSASYNRLRALPDALSSCTALGEVRVAHNRISALPAESVLQQISGLRILDVGHNRLTALDGLAVFTQIQQVNVAGNPVSKDAEACRNVVLGMCGRVQIIDGTRIAGGRRKLRMKREWKERIKANPGFRPGVDAPGSGGGSAGVVEGAVAVSEKKAKKAKRSWSPPKEQDAAATAEDHGRREAEVAVDEDAGGDDDAIDAADFVARAKEASGESKKKKRNKKDKTPAAAVDDASEAQKFGTGGASAWD